MPTPAGSAPVTLSSGPLFYDPVLSRVRLDVTGLVDTVRVERSTDQIVWSTVRGGAALVPVAGEVKLADYEFAAGVLNYYRVVDTAETTVYTGSITPVLDSVWIKDVARPFLNRPVTVRTFSPLRRPGRGGVFEVVGRSFPVAVTDVRGSKRYTLDVITYSDEEAELVDALLATGDILLVQAPTTGRLRAVPDGYVAVADSDEEVLPTLDLNHRVLSVGFTQVAAPGPDIVGATITCAGILNLYASCSALLAAHPTCADVLDLVGDPGDVLVP